ncbi:MAG: YcjX family protein [Notoacmeibacter sp.]
MSTSLTSLTDETLISLDTLGARAVSLVDPSLRLGVTGLSRAGKTVFITALIHALTNNAKLPLLSAQKQGRLKSAALSHQPDDTIPRFQYEDHVRKLIEDRIWPDSTKAISEIRITLHYESASGWNRMFRPGKFSLDIVDYPGEWLLDLPLLTKSYAEFSNDSFALSKSRQSIAAQWHEAINAIAPSDRFNEENANRLAVIFTEYLRAGKSDERALSTLPPGRFLMPGDLAGSPALTFVPMENVPENTNPDTYAGVFARRYEAYKSKVVRPFFREHVAKLDRQIVLIDALQAINAGPDAVADLERALSEILSCFRPGIPGVFSQLFLRRIDRILIAATKADHLHHQAHPALTKIVRRIVESAAKRANLSNAFVDVIALAAARATREGTHKHNGEDLPVILGTPVNGERIGKTVFDGNTETAIFPGDLPENPDSLFEVGKASDDPLLRFVRFRPPKLEHSGATLNLTIPHIRLDKALEFLIGDRLV